MESAPAGYGQPKQGQPAAQPAAGREEVVTTHVPNSVPSAPVPPADNPVRNRPMGRSMGLSLKELSENKPKNEEVARSAAPEAAAKVVATAFDEPKLVAAWDRYAATIDKKVYLKNTMINCKPKLQADFCFEVAVHNPGQREELINNSIYILPFLRKELNNGRVQMRIRIIEGNEKHLAYTSAEKYQHLLEINPLLAKLKDEFDLRLE